MPKVTPSTNINQPVTSNTIDTKSGWTEYKDVQAGYSINYPTSWKLVTYNPSQSGNPKYVDLHIYSPDYKLSSEGVQTLESGTEFFIMVVDTNKSTVGDLFNGDTLFTQIAKNKSGTIVDNQEALQYEFSYESKSATETVSIKSGKVYKIQFIYNEQTDTKQTAWDVYIKLLQSFRFLNGNTSGSGTTDATWKTYISAYGYKLNYPGNWELKTKAWMEGNLQYGLQADNEVVLRFTESNQRPHGGFPYGLTLSLKKPQNNPDSLTATEFAQRTFSNGEIKLSYDTIKVADINSAKATSSFDGYNTNIFIPYNEKMYKIMFNTFAESDEKNNAYTATLNQVLATLKFTN